MRTAECSTSGPLMWLRSWSFASFCGRCGRKISRRPFAFQLSLPQHLSAHLASAHLALFAASPQFLWPLPSSLISHDQPCCCTKLSSRAPLQRLSVSNKLLPTSAKNLNSLWLFWSYGLVMYAQLCEALSFDIGLCWMCRSILQSRYEVSDIHSGACDNAAGV